MDNTKRNAFSDTTLLETPGGSFACSHAATAVGAPFAKAARALRASFATGAGSKPQRNVRSKSIVDGS